MATIPGDGNDNNLAGTPDDDVILGFAGNDTLSGEGGDDRLLGGSGDDDLNGGDGNDVIIGGTGSDLINGGDGDDVSIWVNGDGSDDINGGDGDDLQNVLGSVTDGDNFEISSIVPGIVTLARTNLINFALTIDDVEILRVVGNDGDDSLNVGDLTGTDTGRVIFIGGNGEDSLDASGSSTSITGIGNSGDDVLIGGSAADVLSGGLGEDEIDGGAGNDRLVGGKGDDDIEGGDGNDFSLWVNGDGSDSVDGGDGSDVQRFNMDDGSGDQMTLSGAGGVATFARTNFNQFSVEMTNVERLVVSGLDGDDVLNLDNAEDGGIQSVNFAGGNGQDDVLIDAASTVRIIANGGEGDDELNGGAANDILIGGAGQDLLVGNDGRDRLLGQAGDDTMTGGGGRDTFVFTPGGNNDRITDFTAGEDILRFNLATFEFADLNISDSGGDLRIATPDGDSVTLLGLAGTVLKEADVLIVA